MHSADTKASSHVIRWHICLLSNLGKLTDKEVGIEMYEHAEEEDRPHIGQQAKVVDKFQALLAGMSLFSLDVL